MTMGGFSDHRGYLDLLPWVVNENTGLIILLLLALTTFYAGIHLGWRLFIVGIFLISTSATGALNSIGMLLGSKV